MRAQGGQIRSTAVFDSKSLQARSLLLQLSFLPPLCRSYNQGVLLSGLSQLAAVTGNASYLQAAVRVATAVSTLLSTTGGVLVEPCSGSKCDGDQHIFKVGGGNKENNECQRWGIGWGEISSAAARRNTGPIHNIIPTFYAPSLPTPRSPPPSRSSSHPPSPRRASTCGTCSTW